MAIRFGFDRNKSRDVKRKHGVSLKEAQDIFDQVYVVDQKNDDPEHVRAIGWCGGEKIYDAIILAANSDVSLR